MSSNFFTVSALLALALSPFMSVPQPASAQTVQAASEKPVLTTLHKMTTPDGVYPITSLTQAPNGLFYGVTYRGGLSDAQNPNGYGTLFSIDPVTHQFKVLFKFNGANGYAPQGRLALASDGNLYGVTPGGGKGYDPANYHYGYGTIFRLTPDGYLTTLYKLDGKGGKLDPTELMQASDGNFYGTTDGGSNPGEGRGTIFRFTPDGIYTTLHAFDYTNGSRPRAGITQGPDGALYGTTSDGGKYVKGVVYRLRLNGTFAVLHNFDKTHGANPAATLTLGPDGNLYGTTYAGGAGIAYGYGTVFRITPTGRFTTLYAFGKQSDGLYSYASLAFDASGTLYGTAFYGGQGGYGTIFAMTPDGTYSTLYKFHAAPDGTFPHSHIPISGVTIGNDGALYGTTIGGGNSNDLGTIYKLTLR